MKEDASRRRPHLTSQHLEEGTLAGAIRADDAAQLARVDGKIDVPVGNKTAELFRQASGLQCRSGEGSFIATARRAYARKLRHLDGGLGKLQLVTATPPHQ